MGEESARSERDAALLRNFLSDHDAKCVICGYQLRGLTAAACPECGATPELIVWPRGFSSTPWAVSLVLVAIPVGGAGLVVASFVAAWAKYGMPSPLSLAVANASVFAAGALTLGGLWRWRRKLWIRPRREQWRIGLLLAAILWAAEAGVMFTLVDG